MPDLRLAIRSLQKNPGFCAAVILTLALGTAGTATVFGLADALFLRPAAGVEDADGLIDVGRTDEGEGFDTVSYPNYVDVRARATLLEGLAAFRDQEAFGLEADGVAARVHGGQVSGNYFDVLGVRMQRGRSFTMEDEWQAAPVTVISAALWRSRFAEAQDVVGKQIRLNGRTFIVIGVAVPDFSGHTFASEGLWVPLTTYPEGGAGERLTRRQSTWLQLVGRLAAGVSVDQARTQLATIGRDLQREFPDENRNRGIAVAPTRRVPVAVQPMVAGFVGLLFAMVASVLLIACFNVAGMLLARGAARGREVATRAALGASRQQLIRLFLSESLLLALTGGAAGLGGAYVGLRLVGALRPLFPIPIMLGVRFDWRIALFCAAAAVVTGLVCGLIPALQGARTGLMTTMKPDAMAVPRRLRARSAFVVAEVALSATLLVCALLLARSLAGANAIDVGFISDDVQLAAIDLQMAGYDDRTGPAFAQQLVARVERLAGVVAAASAKTPPLMMRGFSLGAIGAQGRDLPRIDADWNLISPMYFDTLRAPLLSGRGFDKRDDVSAPRVAIVNETLARRFWPDQDPIGQQLVYGPRDQTPESLEIVGVARNAKYRTVGENPRAYVFVPLAQHYQSEMWLLMRTKGPSAIPRLRALLRELDPRLPLVQASTLSEATAFGLLPTRVAAWLATIVGGVGLLVSALGVYGLTSYGVAQRTREIGVRIALGASRANILGLVLRRTAALGGSGALLGLTMAAGATRMLTSMLYGVSPLDPVSFAGATLALGGVVVAAGLLPARRAAALEAAAALRTE